MTGQEQAIGSWHGSSEPVAISADLVEDYLKGLECCCHITLGKAC
jgi:hypothetical protein